MESTRYREDLRESKVYELDVGIVILGGVKEVFGLEIFVADTLLRAVYYGVHHLLEDHCCISLCKVAD